MTTSWAAVLAQGWWPEDPYLQPTPEVMRWLESKHAVAARLRPRMIGEIGVRAGYSAYAMLSAVPASYIGIDVGDSEKYGSEPGALDHGRKLLSRFGALIFVVDSHDLIRIPRVDLLHIDGDHSDEGCTADLELAERSGVPWVLVDDYLTGDVVSGAVDRFAQQRGLAVETIDDGFRGSALISMGGRP